jgi:ribosome-associated toxin RatA of RatAB toxin-antitoxin module
MKPNAFITVDISHTYANKLKDKLFTNLTHLKYDIFNRSQYSVFVSLHINYETHSKLYSIYIAAVDFLGNQTRIQKHLMMLLNIKQVRH